MMLPPLTPSLVLYASAAALVVGFGGGWAVNGWRLGAGVAQAKEAHAQAVAVSLHAAVTQRDATAVERDRLAQQLSDVDTVGSAVLKGLQDENETLRGAVAAGSRVVRVRGAVCPGAPAANVPQAPAGSGVDSGGGTVVDAETGQAVFDLRRDALRVAGKLDACQAALGCITGQRSCKGGP